MRQISKFRRAHHKLLIQHIHQQLVRQMRILVAVVLHREKSFSIFLFCTVCFLDPTILQLSFLSLVFLFFHSNYIKENLVSIKKKKERKKDNKYMIEFTYEFTVLYLLIIIKENKDIT